MTAKTFFAVTVLFFVSFTRAETVIAAESSLEDLCGYSSYKEFVVEAEKAIKTAQENLNPVFQFQMALQTYRKELLLNTIRVNQAARSMREKSIANHSWAAKFFQEFDKLRNSSQLYNLTHAGFGEVIINDSSVPGGEADSTTLLISLQGNTFDTITIKEGEQKAVRTAIEIVGHEYGHLIYDHYLIVSGKYQSVAAGQEALGYLKYHLTVDVIGLILTSTPAPNFVSTLAATIANADQSSFKNVKVDVSDRIRCLSSLPQ